VIHHGQSANGAEKTIDESADKIADDSTAGQRFPAFRWSASRFGHAGVNCLIPIRNGAGEASPSIALRKSGINAPAAKFDPPVEKCLRGVFQRHPAQCKTARGWQNRLAE